MNEAYVFQHVFTGLQVFVYHKHSELQARSELCNVVIIPSDWVYLGKKIAYDVKS